MIFYCMNYVWKIDFYWIAKNISTISKHNGIDFGGYVNVDFEFEMEPSSRPKHIRQEDILDNSKTERPSGSDGIVNGVSQDIIFPENHSFDAGSKYFISIGKAYKPNCYINKLSDSNR